MNSLRRDGAGAISEAQLAREEEGISRITWFGGMAVIVVTVATVLTLFVKAAEEPWHFALYTTLLAVPVAYVLFCNFVTRRMQMALFGRYRAQVSVQLMDLQELVYRDELTGLFNRRHFYDNMQMEVQKAHVSKQPLAILILDLDGLKLINDEYGHRAGDAVISNLGKVISRHTRAHDVPARLGGDEFGIVMPATDKRGAFALARRLWEDLEKTPVPLEDGREISVTVSIGLAGFPWGGESVEEMVQWADADMYANKVSRKLSRQPVPARGQDDTESYPRTWNEGD